MNKNILSFLLLCGASQAMAQQADTCVHLNEITVTSVTGMAQMRHTPTPITVITSTEIAARQFTNVIDAVANQPGVSQLTTGSGISKPVIRGLGYNRVLVVDRGVRQEGQQWGDEHGIEVDAMGVGSVEIQKGPATLMYGSDAMAGVLIFHDTPLLAQGSHRLNIATGYQTNQGLFDYSLNAEGNSRSLAYNWRWTDRMAHDYKNNLDGYVPGSRFRERALTGMLGMNRQWSYSRLRLGYYHLTPGIVEGERDEETGLLERTDNGKHYGAQLPFQQIHHYKVVSDNTFNLGSAALKAIVGYQHNRRQEFEESNNEAGLDFMLHTLSYDVRLVAPEWGGWKTNVDVGGMYQRSLNKGEEYLIPAYHLFDFGLFATASRSVTDRMHLSGGLRYDTRHLHSYSLTDEESTRFETFTRTFHGLTGSMGAVWNVGRHWDVRLNMSRGYRAPNMSELGSNGEHEGTLRYEVGNHMLRPEHSWQFDLGTQYESDVVSAELSLFANHINHYTFLSATGDVADYLPVYGYSQGTARLVGAEARLVVHPIKHFHVENSFAFVRSMLLHQPTGQRNLPFTPAPRWLASVHYHVPVRSRWLHAPYVSAEMDCNLRQSMIYAVADTEAPTPSYTIFNMSAGTDIYCCGRKLLTLSLTANNLFDRAYQNHLSRLKQAEVNAVTGRRGVFNMGRNIGVKLLVPIDL